MKEINIMREYMMEVSKDKNKRVFRNSVGRGVAYDFKNDKVIYPIRVLVFGLCVGSSDLIGWDSVIITQEMVGKKVAIFKAVEVKTLTGEEREMQINFRNAVNEAGGIAIVHKPEKEQKNERNKRASKK